jgi:hypothetical protein
MRAMTHPRAACLRLTRDPDRVRPHISDEALGALGTEIDALIELLGDRHGFARREAELLAGFLLQGRGDERRRWVAAALAARDRLDDEARAIERGHQRPGRLFVAERCLLARDLSQGGHELGWPLRLELGVERPVLDRDERLDLALAVDDQPDRHGLHAPGREPALDLLPE